MRIKNEYGIYYEELFDSVHHLVIIFDIKRQKMFSVICTCGIFTVFSYMDTTTNKSTENTFWSKLIMVEFLGQNFAMCPNVNLQFTAYSYSSKTAISI